MTKNKKHPFGCSEILNNQIFFGTTPYLKSERFLLHSQHEYKIILELLAILFFTECYKVSYHSIHITKVYYYNAGEINHSKYIMIY